jgi:probable addiction module antidote protein
MPVETTKWDVQEFLGTPEDRAAYLEAAFEDGHAGVIADAIGDVARSMGMTSVAKDAGVTREALYKSLSENGDPKLSTLLGVMKALGLRFTVTAADEAA